MVWKREVSKKGSDSKSIRNIQDTVVVLFSTNPPTSWLWRGSHWYERKQHTHIICLSTTVIIKIYIPPSLCFNVFPHISANSFHGVFSQTNGLQPTRRFNPGQAVRLRDMRVSVHLMPLPGALTKEPPGNRGGAKKTLVLCVASPHWCATKMVEGLGVVTCENQQ